MSNVEVENNIFEPLAEMKKLDTPVSYTHLYKPKFHCRRQSGMNFGYVTVNGVNSNNILSVQQCVNIKEKINYGKRM